MFLLLFFSVGKRGVAITLGQYLPSGCYREHKDKDFPCSKPALILVSYYRHGKLSRCMLYSCSRKQRNHCKDQLLCPATNLAAIISSCNSSFAEIQTALISCTGFNELPAGGRGPPEGARGAITEPFRQKCDNGVGAPRLPFLPTVRLPLRSSPTLTFPSRKVLFCVWVFCVCVCVCV